MKMSRKTQFNCRRLLCSWLIIAVVISSIALSSCNPSVVRNANAYNARVTKPKVAPPPKSAKQAVEPDALLEEFENKLASNPSNRNITQSRPAQPAPHQNEATDRRLLTLREQLQTIEEEQVVMKNQVGQLQDDVRDIKYAIDEIRQALVNTERMPERRVVPGVLPDEAPSQQAKPATVTPTKKAANPSVLLPDEAVKRKIPEEAMSNPTPSSNNRNASQPKAQNAASMQADESLTQEQNAETPASTTLSPIDQAREHFALMEYNKSIEVLNEIISTTKDVDLITEANFLLAENYFSLSNFQNAIKHYNIVLNSKNSNRRDEAQAKIADCLLKTGQTSEARSAYRNLIEKYPKSEFVPKARKMLQQM